MAFVPVPGVVEVDMYFTHVNGSKMMNTLYVEMGVTIDEGALDDLANAIDNWWAEDYDSLVSSGITHSGTRCLDLSEEDGIVFETAPGHLGLDNNPIMPNNVTVAIAFKTGRSGRSYRGRNYFIGLTDENVTGDTIASGFISDLIAVYEQLPTVLAVVEGHHVVVSRISNGSERSEGVFTRVTSYAIENTVDSQRRRLLGRGA